MPPQTTVPPGRTALSASGTRPPWGAKRIAGELGITVNTASYHAKRVFERLEVHERSAIGKVLAAAAGQMAH